MSVNKQDFDELKSRFERMESDLKSSYQSIYEWMKRSEEAAEERFCVFDGKLDALDKKVDALDKKVDALDKKVDSLDKKVDGLDKKVDSLDKKVDRLSDDVNHVRLNSSARFDLISGQLRIADQGHFHVENRMANFEERLSALEQAQVKMALTSH